MTIAPERRPIRARSSRLAKAMAAWLVKQRVTPNQVSLAGLGYAAIGAIVLGLARFGWGQPALYLIGALMIELRLLCNMLDGMVAVEGGKGTPAGALFNEVPDRIADALLFAGAGLALGSAFGLALGLVAALFAVTTAYVRALASSLGLPADFSGPMAKPHRMQALAVACVLAAFFVEHDHLVMIVALAVIIVGCAVTIALRLRRAYEALKQKGS